MVKSDTAEPADRVSASLVDLAGRCFVGDLDAATHVVVAHAERRAGGYMCLCNVHVLIEALHDAELRRVVSDASMRFPDGAPVAWLLRRSGAGQARRIGGPDLFSAVVDQGRGVGLRHFFVGSTEPHLEALALAVDANWPGAEVVGRHAPPFAERPRMDEAVELIKDRQPHVVWVGLGAPKQEFWSERASSELPHVTLIGVGAAFDFIAGVKRRAPSWMRRSGLEWLHRLGSEPRRLTSRYARSNTEFVWRASRELTARRHARRT